MPDATPSATGDVLPAQSPKIHPEVHPQIHTAQWPVIDTVQSPVPGAARPPAPGAARHGSWRVVGIGAFAAIIAGCVAAGISAVVPSRAVIPGLPDAGTLTNLALPAVTAVFDFAAAVAVGWLLAALALAPALRDGRLDVAGYRALRAARLAAVVWAVAAFALIPLTVSNTLGRPVSQSLRADDVLSGISALESVRGFLFTGIVATLIALLAPLVLRQWWAGILFVLSITALIPLALTGHSAGTSDHDIAVDTMLYHIVGVSIWVGGLVAFLGLARQRAVHLDVIARRYSGIALIAFITVALSGIGNAWVRVPYLGDLWTTDYGRLVLLKAALLIGLGGFGYAHRRRSIPAITGHGKRGPLLRLALGEIVVMGATIGVAAALARTATPAPSATLPTDSELVLGYGLPGPPTALRLFFDWRFDFLLGTASLVAAGLYLAAVIRLHRRGDAWPLGRTAAWLGGCLVVLIATSSGFGRYAPAQFSIHMMVHMTLGMLAPILLVLGGPLSLALRTLPAAGHNGVPGLREAIVGVLHSRYARFVTHPLIIFPLFVGSFYAIYFTDLFDLMITSHLGHVIMNVHFLVLGYLFYWVIIGVDPAPRQIPPMFKLGMLMASLPFHAFFGLALMNSRTAMAHGYFQSLSLPWITDLAADQRLGGGIAWGGTEIPVLIVMIALLAQWARQDDRMARRQRRGHDAAADAEFAAYNKMLAQLAERDRSAPGD